MIFYDTIRYDMVLYETIPVCDIDHVHDKTHYMIELKAWYDVTLYM